MLGLRSLHHYFGHHGMFLFANIKDRYVTSENPESDQNGHDTSVTMGCYA